MADLGIPGLGDAVEVGRGGFAVVYRAEQSDFHRTVAVKLLFADRLTELDLRRFERERQTMGSLSAHRSIVTIYDAGYNDIGRPYLVMAYMDNGSLADRLERDGAFTWNEVAEIGATVAEALDAAHSRGIVHRDVKPANILTSEYGDVQLSDFGIARLDGATHTSSGVITATLAHAAPEVLDGADPSPASDVYSLGSTLYELLTGTAAFAGGDGSSLVGLIRRIVIDDVPDLRAEGHPAALASVIERSMAKDPADRYGSAAEMAADLRAAMTAPLATSDGTRTVPPEATNAVTSEGTKAVGRAAPATAIAPAPTPVVNPSRRGLYVAGALVAVVVAAVLAVIALQGDDTPDDTVAGGPTTVVDAVTSTSESDSTATSTTTVQSSSAPSSTAEEPPATTVPPEAGQSAIAAPTVTDPAGSEVIAAGLRPIRTLRPDPEVPAGQLIEQIPAPGEGTTGGNVHLIVSLGPEDSPAVAPCPGAVVIDGIAAGSIDADGQRDACTFEAAEGDVIGVNLSTGGDLFADWTLSGPNGERLCGPGSRCRIDNTGTQTLTIEDFQLDDTGPYLMNLQRISSTAGCPQITLGDIVEGELTVDGDWDCYRVDLVEGSVVRIEKVGSQGLGETWALYDPFGEQLCGPGGRCRVGDTGPHRLVFEDIGLEDAGTYLFNIQPINDTTSCPEIAIGEIGTGSFTTDGEWDCYRLVVNDGEVVRIVSSGSDGLSEIWDLYDTFGDRVCSSASICRIEESASFRLVFEDIGLEDEGIYSFNVQRVDSADDCPPLADGETVEGRLDVVADYRCFALAAEEDNVIEIVADSRDGVFPGWELRDRFGARVCRAGPSCQVDETGVYRLIVEDVALDDRGTFTLTASLSTP